MGRGWICGISGRRSGRRSYAGPCRIDWEMMRAGLKRSASWSVHAREHRERSSRRTDRIVRPGAEGASRAMGIYGESGRDVRCEAAVSRPLASSSAGARAPRIFISNGARTGRRSPFSQSGRLLLLAGPSRPNMPQPRFTTFRPSPAYSSDHPSHEATGTIHARSTSIPSRD